MKIAASYINSLHDEKKTIELLNKSIVDYIHVDLMDGKYVANKNFTINKVIGLHQFSKKPLTVHLMVNEPINYIEELSCLNIYSVTFHPNSTKDPLKVIQKIKSLNLNVGIAINPDEDINNFQNLFPLVDEVLVMSVNPGLGGQKFKESVLEKITNLLNLKKKYNFEIVVDGGINDTNIHLINQVDTVVSGSYICFSDNYNEAIKKLKKS